MKKSKISMFFGILFGILLIPVAYLCLALGIALAFLGDGWFGFMTYVLAGFGLLSIIASCFAIKKPIVTLTINCLSALSLLFSIIYLMIKGILFENVLILLILVIVLAVGLLSIIFASLAIKNIKKIKNINDKNE